MVVFRRERQTLVKRKRTEDCHAELFPNDFGDRLERLIELAGLSWDEFARIVSVRHDHLTEWREGTIPTGGEVWRIMSLARSVPGGFEIMLPVAAGSDQGGSNDVVRRQQWVYRIEPSRFPPDFPERLERFMEAAELSSRDWPGCCGWTTGCCGAGGRGRSRTLATWSPYSP